jgi:hypothetical protein
MNFKTTIVLAVLVVVGGLVWLVYPSQRKHAAGSESLTILEKEIKPERLRRIEVIYPERSVVFERSPDGEWTLPGKWPTRQAEVEQLVNLLASFHSRFAPIALGNSPDLAGYGLDKPPVKVKAQTDGGEYLLEFGEEPGESNRFIRATFLRINEGPEVVRLAPGIVASLTRPFGFFQQHQLFAAESVKDSDSPEKREQLSAKSLTIGETKPGAVLFTLGRAGEDWQIQKPVQDLPDPEKLKTILTAVPDIWVEKFVEGSHKDLAEYGLKDPEQTIQVTKNNGETLVLLIGKESSKKERTVTRPSPQFGPPQPPRTETIVDRFRYAKLKDNDQVFEINEGKLKAIFVGLDVLRDAHLARFRSFDANHLEINHAEQTIIIDKDKGVWKLKKPLEAEADSGKVNDLLDKLSALEAKDKDVIDKGDAKSYGLDKPADTIQVQAEESKGEGEKKTTKTKTFAFALGKRDSDKKKVYVRVSGRERINAVDDSIVKLVDQPVLAYRSKRLLDLFTGDLAKLEIHRGDQQFTLEQEKANWRLTSPVKADADQAKANQLAGDLGRLEVVEYVANEAKKEDLDKLYGLEKPPLSVTVTPNKKEKPAQTLLVGKQRGDKGEFFAKLASAPGIFVVKKEIHDALDQGSLAFRPRQLWNVKADEIAELRLQKEDRNELLKREGSSWQIVEPFAAPALPREVDKIVKALASPSCVRYEAHIAKELKTYGLDKPYLRVALTTAEKKDEIKPKDESKAKEEIKPKDETKSKEKAKEHVLLVGKPTAEGQKSRFAKLGDAEAVFVVDQALVTAVDQNALDLLDRELLKLNAKDISRIETTKGGTILTLRRDKDDWQVEASAAQFTADREVMASVLKVWANLKAEKFAAYGPKVESTVYGLDKPAATIHVSLAGPADAKNKTSHTLVLGKPVDKDANARFGRLDNGPGVLVLSADQVVELTHPYLDFVDRNLLNFAATTVTGLDVKQGNEELSVVKRDDAWQLVKPAPFRADDQTVDQLLGQLSHLRAKKVAAYPAKDLKAFGLENPSGTVTIRLGGQSKLLKLGKVMEEKKPSGLRQIAFGRVFLPSADRFALVEGSDVVAVLDGSLAGRLTSSPLYYRDRNVARFADADRAVLERGPRKAVFAKIEGTWKLTEPIQAEAEQAELEELINALARLRAEELVAEKPADLKPFGLDKPQAHWHFFSGDKQVLDLLVGARAESKLGGEEGCYAKLAKGDLVFTLDRRVTSKALGEYRSRNIWASLDSAQVDRISFGYAQNPFVLEKTDNTWHVQGKSTLQIKTEAVTETLDALARLKVERYVVDKDADWKLYGLEPPQLILEIQTPAEKKVLHLGRTEGGSKRYYARIPEPNRSDVFLISEADAAHIVRQLSAFTK